MRKEWSLTMDAFDRLLGWLGPDPEQAGRRYETIRRRLIEIFACRGCPEAEDLADETINRVTRKLPEIIETYVGDPALYFYGVAQKVYLEWLRSKARPAIAPPPPATHDEGGNEPELKCLNECMSRLPPNSREMIARYYAEESVREKDRRRRLALLMGISFTALRLRAHRVRAALLRCVKECLGGAAEKQI